MARTPLPDPIPALEQWLERVRPEADLSVEEAREELGATVEELRVAVEELRERLLALEQVRLAERTTAERHRDLLDQLPDGFVVTDPSGIIRSANRAASALFGIRADALPGKPLTVLIALPERHAFRTWLAEVRAGGAAAFRRESGVRRRAGGTVPVHLTAVCDASRDSGEREIRWTIRDVTEERVAERRLRESEALFRAIFENGPGAILVTRLDGAEILAANEPFAALFGFSLEEARDRTPTELGLSYAPGAERTILEDLRRSRLLRDVPVRLRRKDGAFLSVLASGAAVDLGDDELAVWFLKDVTEQERVEAELRGLQADHERRNRLAEVGAVAARIVHDVGNPLTGISLIGQRIARDARSLEGAAGARLAASGELVVSQVERLMERLEQLLESGRHRRLKLAEVDLSRVLREIAEFWRPVARRRRLGLRLDLPEPLPTIRSDAEHVRRILENLIKNAIEAMALGSGSVELSARRRSDGLVRLTVRDAGPGIPAGFDPFSLFQTTKASGTGIGLSTARELALTLGGALGFERLDSGGTAFHLDLPIGAARRGSRERAAVREG